jgi:hypothetical protein
MAVVEILKRSLEKSVKPKRFLPFFVLYFIFSLALLAIIYDLLPPLQNIIMMSPSELDLQKIIVDSVLIIIASIIMLVVSTLLNGALIFGLSKGKVLSDSIGPAKRFFWKMTFFAGLIAVINILSTFLGDLSLIISFIAGWVLMFSMVSIVVRDDTLNKSLRRSYEIVRKNVGKTFVFYIISLLIWFLILIVGLVFVDISLFPMFSRVEQFFPDPASWADFSSAQSVTAIGVVLEQYPYLILASAVASLFLAIASVFIQASRTYYFLSFKKK